MKINKANLTEEMGILKIAAFIFIPTTMLMVVYICMGYMQNAIPSFLLFSLLAMIILFPIEIGVVLKASKKKWQVFVKKLI